MSRILLHADAPPKPPEGAPCNGCGVCCAMEKCPVALIFLPLGTEPCPALEWDNDSRRYRCGMVVQPARHLRWLPRRWERQAGKWFAYRIAASKGCDCSVAEIRDADT
jgi:hypothetical protein